MHKHNIYLLCVFVICFTTIITITHAATSYVTATTEEDFESVFTQWTHKHEKLYNNDEFQRRYTTFKANLRSIQEHNSKSSSNFQQGLNHFSDLTFEEFSSIYLGFNSPTRPALPRPNIRPSPHTPVDNNNNNDDEGGEVDNDEQHHKRGTCASGYTACGSGCCKTAANYACVSNQCLSCPTGNAVCGSYCCPTASTTCVSGQCVAICASGYANCGTGCCPTASNYACINKQCVSCSNGVPCGSSCCPTSYTCTATGCSGAQLPTGGPLTPTVNWTAQGYVTPVKNQGNCGSCWSFATTGAVEAAYNIKHSLTGNSRVSLSEQNLIDCSTNNGNSGCNGGVPLYGMQYIISNGGIDTDRSYPLKSNGTGTAGTCAYNAANKGASITAANTLTPGSESTLQSRVAIQPVSVAICAAPSLQSYIYGVYDDTACGVGSSAALNHAVLVVGYGTDVSAGAYWIVKNSWGTSWGMNGYFLLQKGVDRCGVTQQVAYPTAA